MKVSMKVKIEVLLLVFVSSLSSLAQSDPIIGQWEADGWVGEYKTGPNNTYENYLISIPQKYAHLGFFIGEKVKTLKRVGTNEYEGEEKVRFSGGEKFEWRPVRYIVEGNLLKKVSMHGGVLSTSKRRGASNTGVCLNLLGIGKLIGMLEMGAINNYDNNWMIGTIDYALSHISSSGCIDGTYLTNLKPRILRNSDNRQFYNEIHNYSLSLDSEVLKCF